MRDLLVFLGSVIFYLSATIFSLATTVFMVAFFVKIAYLVFSFSLNIVVLNAVIRYSVFTAAVSFVVVIVLLFLLIKKVDENKFKF